jgi:hypothetical protein
MRNRSHKLRIVILFVGLFLAVLCQVELAPAEGLPVPSESGPGGASHGTALCAQSLMTSTALLVYFCIITPVAAVALGNPAPEHTLPFYRPPCPTA